MSKFLSILSLTAIVAVGILWTLWRGERSERQRFQSNQSSLLSEVDFYKTEAGKNAASVERLTLTAGEFKRYFDDYNRTIEQLGIRLRRVESVAQTATRGDYHIETIVRDSLVIREKLDTVKVVEYRDPYIDFNGVVDGSLFRGDIVTYDTIDQVIHRVPRKFLFFRFGTKAIRQEVVARNPHSMITYSKYIKLGKKE